MKMLPPALGHETHEQFLQRASGVFPVDSTGAWTPFERAIFNHLMAKLIFRHGYDGISDAMLEKAFAEMTQIVSRFSIPSIPPGEPSNTSPEYAPPKNYGRAYGYQEGGFKHVKLPSGS